MKLAAGCLADEDIAECEGWMLVLGEYKEEIKKSFSKGKLVAVYDL